MPIIIAGIIFILFGVIVVINPWLILFFVALLVAIFFINIGIGMIRLGKKMPKHKKKQTSTKVGDYEILQDKK